MNDLQRAEHDLRVLRLWMPRLRWFLAVADSTGLSEHDKREREAFPYEWANIVGRVEKIEQLAHQGRLAPPMVDALRAIAEELTGHITAMRQRRLRLPELEALRRAAERPAAARPG
jgi:hypothetical protein